MLVPTSSGLMRSRSLRDRRALASPAAAPEPRVAGRARRETDTGYQQSAAYEPVPAAPPSPPHGPADVLGAPPPLQLGHDVGHPGAHARGLGRQLGQLLNELRVADEAQLRFRHHRSCTSLLPPASPRGRTEAVFSNPCSTLAGAADIVRAPAPRTRVGPVTRGRSSPPRAD